MEADDSMPLSDSTPRAGIPKRFAYADPPYLGMCSRYGHEHGDGGCWDEIATHALLIDRLREDFDGWALSLLSRDLREILPLCPPEARVGAWVKGWCSFKPGVSPAYAWEPVIFQGGRAHDRDTLTVRDWTLCNATTGKGFFGAKPGDFAAWVRLLFNPLPQDEVVDLFRGSGSCADAFAQGVLL